jgi:hypothetical protein
VLARSERIPESLLLPLLSCAREEDARIRMPALRALAGWDDSSVHTLFLDELEHALAGARDAASTIAEKHFRTVILPPRGPHVARLSEMVMRGLASSDWREVSRAIAFSRPLGPDPLISYLIEAMRQWQSRGDAGAQSLRIQMELMQALENRSGEVRLRRRSGARGGKASAAARSRAAVRRRASTGRARPRRSSGSIRRRTAWCS